MASMSWLRAGTGDVTMSLGQVVPLFGHQRAQPRLQNSEVTVQRLCSILSAAFPCSIDKDGDICVEDDDGFVFWLILDTDQKLIHLGAFWEISHASLERINELNRKYNLVQFSMTTEHVNADYCLLYDDELDIRPLIAICEKFAMICKVAIRQLDRGPSDSERTTQT